MTAHPIWFIVQTSDNPTVFIHLNPDDPWDPQPTTTTDPTKATRFPGPGYAYSAETMITMSNRPTNTRLEIVMSLPLQLAEDQFTQLHEKNDHNGATSKVSTRALAALLMDYSALLADHLQHKTTPRLRHNTDADRPRAPVERKTRAPGTRTSQKGLRIPHSPSLMGDLSTLPATDDPDTDMDYRKLEYKYIRRERGRLRKLDNWPPDQTNLTEDNSIPNRSSP